MKKKHNRNKLLTEIAIGLAIFIIISFIFPKGKEPVFIIYIFYLLSLFLSKIPTAIVFEDSRISIEYYQFGRKVEKSCRNKYVYYYYGYRRVGRGFPEKCLEIFFCGDKVVSFKDIFSGWSEEEIIEILGILKEKNISDQPVEYE